ncbi:hypothetical protein B0A48_01000 [Cryoendolithus antarcticus]|uniref:Uncharacterized protein n=1 Tax=Cryoendolithus antarcticus TaxID=1507870 RepID=A0A1V8TS33_9PEZI|nr:hypothetical protein B0A48_01000 [Cryoendolithus antarcticus]
MFDFQSCIDDSFGAAPWPARFVPSVRSDAQANGPRDGHWDVASSAGSFIDDCCPRAVGYAPLRSTAGHVKPLGNDLVRQLTKATLEDRAAAAKRAVTLNVTKAGSVHSMKSVRTIEPPTKQRAPFAVPHITSSKERAQVYVQAQSRTAVGPTRANGTAAEAALFTKTASVTAKVIPEPETTWKAAERPTVVPGLQRVRIVGKKGEEVFVNLPTAALRKGRSEAQPYSPRANAVAEAHLPDTVEPVVDAVQPDQTDTAGKANKGKKGGKGGKGKKGGHKGPLNKDGKKANEDNTVDRAPSAVAGITAQNILTVAKSIASAPREPPTTVKQAGEQRSPAASVTPNQILAVAQKIASMPASKHSSKENGSNYKAPSVHTDRSSTAMHDFGGGVGGIDMFAEAAPSIRRTSVPPSQADMTRVSASKPASRTLTELLPRGCFSSRQSSQHVESTPRRSQTAAMPTKGSQQQHAVPAGGQLFSARQESVVQQAVNTTQTQWGAQFSHHSQAANGGREVTTSQQKGSERGSQPSARESFESQSKTKFAGTGWISPHPLSVAPTAVCSPRQPAVRLPGESFDDPGATLTYEEWKEQRDEQATVVSSSSRGQYMVPSLAGSKVRSPPVAIPTPLGYGGSYSVPTMPPQPQHPVHTHDWAGPNAAVPYARTRQAHVSPTPLSANPVASHGSSTLQHPFQSSNARSNTGWNQLAQFDGSPQAPYTVGVSPSELQHYNERIGSTVSHYTDQTLKLRNGAVLQQPDYSSWERHSRSSQAFQPVTSRPATSVRSNGQIQLAMPWDNAAAMSSHSTTLRPSGSRYSAPVAQSNVTYGAQEWQNLENAENGQGGFQSRQMW